MTPLVLTLISCLLLGTDGRGRENLLLLLLRFRPGRRGGITVIVTEPNFDRLDLPQPLKLRLDGLLSPLGVLLGEGIYVHLHRLLLGSAGASSS